MKPDTPQFGEELDMKPQKARTGSTFKDSRGRSTRSGRSFGMVNVRGAAMGGKHVGSPKGLGLDAACQLETL